MMENGTPIYVNNTEIENVESYVYLGQRYSTRDKNQDKEIQRRITRNGQLLPSIATFSEVTLEQV
ncbi:hypothetical protein NP493_136g00011 [Ridgeia piscesae]|uniref:Uncharacterized protein n=1 Tax=Ridgeia piscesae TaxID=27915 RepID=A0AAD9UG78_RIDPI|nr:hypothetical protein NP493_136g00011 [Ridgeia piscesae]